MRIPQRNRSNRGACCLQTASRRLFGEPAPPDSSRSRHIENALVFFRISTSSITLSTLRRAFDLDYRCVVLNDACFDPDEEVHRVLTEKIFPAQAEVVTVDAFIAEQGKVNPAQQVSTEGAATKSRKFP